MAGTSANLGQSSQVNLSLRSIGGPRILNLREALAPVRTILATMMPMTRATLTRKLAHFFVIGSYLGTAASSLT